MTHDKYGTRDDPYCYPDSDVLRNMLNIEDNTELNEAEEVLTELAALQIEFDPPPYTLDYLKSIHQQLFEDLYEWAGDLRSIDLTKGTTRFCNVNRVIPEAHKLFKALKKANYFINHKRGSLVEAAAEFYIELNIVHPFREGNGRVQRILFEHIIINCGFEFDLEGITQHDWVGANIAGVGCNYIPMIELFEQCIGENFIA